MRTQGNAPPVFPRKVLYFGSRPTERIPALRAVRITSGVQAESRRAIPNTRARGCTEHSVQFGVDGADRCVVAYNLS
jgi:hypothetical protein